MSNHTTLNSKEPIVVPVSENTSLVIKLTRIKGSVRLSPPLRRFRGEDGEENVTSLWTGLVCFDCFHRLEYFEYKICVSFRGIVE